MSMQELKSSGCCGLSIQPEAGGQLGEARAAVSWEWLPEAPCSIACEGRACEFTCPRSGTVLLDEFSALPLGAGTGLTT